MLKEKFMSEEAILYFKTLFLDMIIPYYIERIIVQDTD